MQHNESLEKGVELLESFSICDSLNNFNRCTQVKSSNRANTIADEANIRGNDEHSDSPLEEIQSPILTHDGGNGCTDTCKMTILNLINRVKLLEAQNSQLIINSCALYNTLTQHISDLNTIIEGRRRHAR